VSAAGRRAPNIVMLLADQWRGTDQGWRGNRDVRTPHLDRLAREGVAVRGAYANAPVCGPSRASLLTGLLPHQHTVVANDLALPAGIPTIAEVLAGQGYRTGWIGKWHLDGLPRDTWVAPDRRRGFDFWAATNCSHAYLDAHYYTGDDPAPVPFQGYEPVVQSDLAAEFLARADDRPVFLVVSYGPPHDPYEDVPETYLARFDGVALTMRANATADPPGMARLRQYYAAIAAVDDQVGRIVEVLDALDLTADTLLVVTSDHGDMLGSHGRTAKQVPYEESISVPLVFSWPGRLSGGDVGDGVLGLVDLAPTLLGLVGAPPLPHPTYGIDLSQAIADPPGRRRPLRDAVLLSNTVSFDQGYAQGVPEWRGVRTPEHTYARDADGTPWLLFDNHRDRWQQDNLVGTPRARQLLRRMDSLLDLLLADAGDVPDTGAAVLRRLGLVDAWNARERQLHGPAARLLSNIGGTASSNSCEGRSIDR
jgi:arylsulfatase A-like enzyme